MKTNKLNISKDIYGNRILSKDEKSFLLELKKMINTKNDIIFLKSKQDIHFSSFVSICLDNDIIDWTEIIHSNQLLNVKKGTPFYVGINYFLDNYENIVNKTCSVQTYLLGNTDENNEIILKVIINLDDFEMFCHGEDGITLPYDLRFAKITKDLSSLFNSSIK